MGFPMISSDVPPKKRTRRKKQVWRVGDIVAVRLSDGSRRLGQVVAHQPKQFLSSVVCGFTLVEAPVEGEPCPGAERSAFIAVKHVTPELLDSGEWSVIGHTDVPDFATLVDARTLTGAVGIGTQISGSGLAVRFLEACMGLRPWDEMHDPAYYDAWLLLPSMKPERLIYAKTGMPTHAGPAQSLQGSGDANLARKRIPVGRSHGETQVRFGHPTLGCDGLQKDE